MDKIYAHIIYDRRKDSFHINLPSPLSVCWQVNLNCNLKCKFCISDSEPNGFEGLPVESAIDVISRLCDAGIKRLDFSGGEPLLRQDLPQLLKYAKKRGVSPVVTTNGVLINDEHIDLFKETVSAIQVSIDGPRELHDSLKGASVFDQTVSNIRKLVESGCNVRIITVLFKGNLESCEYLLELSSELGVFSHFLNPLIPVGRGESSKNEMISDSQIRNLRRKIFRLNAIQNPRRYVRILDYEDCNGAMVVISATGEILSQPDINKPEKKLGNILTDDINKIFKDSSYDHRSHLTRYLKNPEPL